MDKRLKPSIFEVNILYLILAIFLLFIGSYVQSVEIYSGLLITEYILILLPSLLFLKIKGYSIKGVLRLNKINFKQILMIITITVCTYPLAVFLQSISINIINKFTDVIPTEVPLPENSPQYLISLFIIAISPGICEEIMFRGIILDAYESIGRKRSIVISASLFAIFHFTIFNMVGPLLLGIVFGIMVYQTNSIYSSIIGHIVNNGIAITIGYYMNKYYYLIDNKINQEIGPYTILENIASFLILIGLLFICFFIVIKLLKKLSEYNNIDHKERLDDKDSYSKGELIVSKFKYIPIFIVVLIFILLNWAFVLN